MLESIYKISSHCKREEEKIDHLFLHCVAYCGAHWDLGRQQKRELMVHLQVAGLFYGGYFHLLLSDPFEEKRTDEIFTMENTPDDTKSAVKLRVETYASLKKEFETSNFLILCSTRRLARSVGQLRSSRQLNYLPPHLEIFQIRERKEASRGP